MLTWCYRLGWGEGLGGALLVPVLLADDEAISERQTVIVVPLALTIGGAVDDGVAAALGQHNRPEPSRTAARVMRHENHIARAVAVHELVAMDVQSR